MTVKRGPLLRYIFPVIANDDGIAYARRNEFLVCAAGKRRHGTRSARSPLRPFWLLRETPFNTVRLQIYVFLKMDASSTQYRVFCEHCQSNVGRSTY